MIIHKNPNIMHEKCYVAFLDLLGFKEMLYNETPEKIEGMYEALFTYLNSLKGLKAQALSSHNKAVDYYNNVHKNLFIGIRSDSIVLAIKADEDKDLSFLIYVCDHIQKRLFNKHDMILRGGISYGAFYGCGDIIFGHGFDKALKLENEAIYPRIIIDRELYETVEESDGLWNYKLFKDFDYWSINWMYYISSEQKVLEYCKQQIVTHKDDKTQNKYLWILRKIGVTYKQK